MSILIQMGLSNGEEVTLASGKKLNSNLVSKDFKSFNKHILYEPETGEMTWRFNYKGRRAGVKVGCIDDKGYRLFKLNQIMYYVHRVAWLLYYGTWPSQVIDHINHSRADNRIINLRDVSYEENQLNRQQNRPSLSGHPGIRLNPTGSYSAFTLGSRKRKYLGNRWSLEKAIELQKANQ